MAEIVQMPVRSYRDLKVWQDGKALTLVIYKLTTAFPKEELYGLTSQLRRCAVSIPSNIAEGNARSTKDYMRFLNMALGSLAELETQIEIAHELHYITSESRQTVLTQTETLGKMLRSLHRKLHAQLP